MAIKYYYHGISLYQYCKDNGLHYTVIVRQIKAVMDRNPQMRLEEVIQNFIKKNNVRDKYYYKGVTLRKYCETHNLNYDTIHQRIVRIREKNPDIDSKEVVEMALAQTPWTKYYYQGESLWKYCERNGFDINDVTKKMKRVRNANGITLEEAINETVAYYEKKRYLQNITKIFTYLKSCADVDKINLKKITVYLNIDYDNLMKLQNEMKFPTVSVMALIWYFHDNPTGTSLSISEKKLKEVLLFVRALSNETEENAKYMDFGDLFGIYKTGLFDSRYFLLLLQEDFIYFTILRTKDEFSLNLNREVIDDIYHDVSVYFLELLDKIDNNIIGAVITYITKAIRGYVWDSFNKLKKDRSVLSLQHTSDLNGKPSRSLLEKTPNSISNEFDCDSISFLKDLDTNFKNFIFYKYHEGLSYDQIAQVFHMSVKEVEVLEKSLLNELRKNEVLKEFFSKKTR